VTLTEHFAANRIAWSRAVLVAALGLMLFGSPPRYLGGWLAELSELLGFALLAAATLWRIWCHLFIAGAKNGELAASGPYSVVRNPLYLGSFTGIVGFGFAVEQPLFALACGLAFALLYPAVVAREERHLAALFGERFEEYRARVPRWLPDWSLYREPAALTVSPPHVRKAILDAMWFLWAFGLWEFIEQLHETGILPTYF
jgi:protein-S-isoprenylcysteine O-methyltransferase Ste14